MNSDDQVQRIIFRPVAVQRYVQGHNDDTPPPRIESPRIVWSYVVIVICVIAAFLALNTVWSAAP